MRAGQGSLPPPPVSSLAKQFGGALALAQSTWGSLPKKRPSWDPRHIEQLELCPSCPALAVCLQVPVSGIYSRLCLCIDKGQEVKKGGECEQTNCQQSRGTLTCLSGGIPRALGHGTTLHTSFHHCVPAGPEPFDFLKLPVVPMPEKGKK